MAGITYVIQNVTSIAYLGITSETSNYFIILLFENITLWGYFLKFLLMVIVSSTIALFLHTKLAYKGQVFSLYVVKFIFVYVYSNDDM